MPAGSSRHSGFPIFPFSLLILWVGFTVWFGIAPYYRELWVLESLPSWTLVALTLFLYFRNIRFSDISYFLIFFVCFIVTLGAHYSYAEVPFAWFNDALDSWAFWSSDLRVFVHRGRNGFDRVGHFCIGLLAFPLLEWIEMKKVSSSRFFVGLMTLMFFFGVAAIYEIFEWFYAAMLSTSDSTATAFLGEQGDQWDAQKDMALDGLGALLSMIAYGFVSFFRGPWNGRS